MVVRFGVIFITDGFITDDKTKELRSILERKKECNFIWFNESSAIIHNTPIRYNIQFKKLLVSVSQKFQ